MAEKTARPRSTPRSNLRSRLKASPADDGLATGADSGTPDAYDASLRLLQRENGMLRLLVGIHERLGSLVLEGASTESITTVLSQLVSRPVLLLDPMLRPVAQDGHRHPSDDDAFESDEAWNPSEAYVGRVLQTITGERRALRLPPLPGLGVNHACVLAPVVVGKAVLGYLAILEPPVANEKETALDIDLVAAQHAARVYAMALMREGIAAEVWDELRAELLEGLLQGQSLNDQAARERARQLGYDETRIYRTLVFVPDDGGLNRQGGELTDLAWASARRSRLRDNIAQIVRERAPQAVIAARQEELVVLLPEDVTPSPTELARAVVLKAGSFYPDRPVTVGIGGICDTATAIARSYAQARRAAEVALRFGRRGQVVTFESLGLYRLLFQVADRGELRSFLDQILGPLIAYDRKHKTDLVHTLDTYLANNSSLQATARELYVHVNTAAYRIQRIQQITGLDLSRTDDCLLVRVALMIREDATAGAGTLVPQA